MKASTPMYLLSIYFDTKTEKHIQGFISQVAKKTGNTYMLNGNVPPHITVAAFDAQNIEDILVDLGPLMNSLAQGRITWASVAAFLPSVIYIAPVLNRYLQELSETLNGKLAEMPGVQLRLNYQPFNWMPHTTIGKKLTQDQMQIAFETMQKSFGMFEGTVNRIGLAKTNPYTDIKVWELK